MNDIAVIDQKRQKVRDKDSVKKKHRPIRTRLLRTPEGRRVKVPVVDANSATFVSDLTAVFQNNVSKARDENFKFFGSREGYEEGYEMPRRGKR